MARFGGHPLEPRRHRRVSGEVEAALPGDMGVGVEGDVGEAQPLADEIAARLEMLVHQPQRRFACLAEEGRHVTIAGQRGPTAEIPLWDVMRKCLTLTGSTLRARSVDFKAALASELEREVWPHLEAGRIRPVIHATFPLADAAGAHRLMDSGDHVGKIVLEVR